MRSALHRIAAWIRLLLVTLFGCVSAPAPAPPKPPAAIVVPAKSTTSDCDFVPTTDPMCPVRGTCKNKEAGLTLFIEVCKDSASDL